MQHPAGPDEKTNQGAIRETSQIDTLGPGKAQDVVRAKHHGWRAKTWRRFTPGPAARNRRNNAPCHGRCS